MRTVALVNPVAPWGYPRHQRRLYASVFWAVQDMHPDWAKRLMNTPKLTPLGRFLRRRFLKLMLNSFGKDPAILEVRQARARVAASRPVPAEIQESHA